MQVTQGKASPFPEEDVLLDVYDASTGVFPLQVGNGGNSDFRQPAALVTRGSTTAQRNQTTAANNLSFYANVNAWMDAASVKVGGGVAPRTSSNQGVGWISASWLNWVVGYDPQALGLGLVQSASYFHKLRWESVIRCNNSTGSFRHGWDNGVSSDPFNPVGIGSLSIMAVRGSGSTSFDNVFIRNNTAAGAGSISSVAISPVECVAQFVNVRWEVTLGPTFRIELFFNETLAWASDNASIAWSLASATNAQLVMCAAMGGNGGAAPAGFVGPIASRGTILRVS